MDTLNTNDQTSINTPGIFDRKIKKKNPCILQAWSPLICYLQIQGLFPISFDQLNCKVYPCGSLKAKLCNLGWFVISILASILILYTSARIMLLFHGTDLYTVVAFLALQLFATIVSFGVGGYGAFYFSRSLQNIHDIADELGFMPMEQIRWFLFFIPFNLAVEAVFNMIVIYLQIESRYNVSPIIGILGTFMTNLIPNLVVSLMTISMWTVGCYFNHVNELVHDKLGDSIHEDDDYCKSVRLFELRQVHEQLCEVCRNFARAFELQLLVIFPATNVRLLAGFYGLVITMLGLIPFSMHFVVAQSIVCLMSCVRLALIIGSSQYVTNKASDVTQVLKCSRRKNNSSELNEEIDTFLNKLGAFPLEIKCFNIIKLDLSFLATAVPNVITYVLVLVQFKQGDISGSKLNCTND